MTEAKKCSKCGEVKLLIKFNKNKYNKDGLSGQCIICIKNYKVINKEKIKEQTKKYNQKRKEQKKYWAESNKEKVKESRKKWNENNKEKRKEYLKQYNKEYAQKNKKVRLEYAKNKQKEYRENNPIFKLKSNLRRRINRYIKSKSKSTEEILGIDYVNFLKYIESKFTEGMTWDLMGKFIHIDHIIPLSSAKSQEELYNLCHYTNLQPMWAKDNLKKSNKTDYL